MLTKAQFQSLKVGDVLLMHGKPRTVRYVRWLKTAWGGRGSIAFSILRRSWTGRIYTIYGYHDIKHCCSLPRKDRDRSELCKAEEAALCASGFDVLGQIEREIAEDERLKNCGLRDDPNGRAATALLKRCRRKLKRRKSA